eukprot:2127089-Pyramimonas_sp.AAC.1
MAPRVQGPSQGAGSRAGSPHTTPQHHRPIRGPGRLAQASVATRLRRCHPYKRLRGFGFQTGG